MGWTKRWSKRLRALLRKDTVERELDEELAYHLEMETQKNLGAGMSPEEARRQARVAFGGVERYKEEVRDARALAWVGGMSLDFKLGLRMLVKYPGLALVGTLAMSVGIGLGAAYLEVVNDFLHPTLPLEDGERIVGIRIWDRAASGPELRSLHDFVTWREALESVEDLGAFRTLERNLITGEGEGAPVEGAEISASAFRLVRVPALLGRTLVETDEREGAPPVVVLGYRAWQSRFGGDAGVVGRTVRLGDSPHTVVGVMPEGFAFPVSHGFWVPLRLSVLDYERRQGPSIQVFGRLAPGVTLEEAQAELTATGLRAAADFPDTHERLRPQIMPYTQLFLGGGGASQLYLIESIFVMVLVLICANVATLVFARTATRESEIAVRTALGASRGRIVGQLFVEALLLALLAAVIAVATVSWGIKWAVALFWSALGGQAPFWWNDSLAPATVLYAGALAVLGAVIVGVVPALKATGPRVLARLERAAARGSSLRLGGIWTGVLITQVAFSVAILPPAIAMVRAWVRTEASDLGFPAEEYLSVRLEMDREPAPSDSAMRAAAVSRFRTTYEELGRRLAAVPGVTGVTFADRFPGMNHRTHRVEVDGVEAPARSGIETGGSDAESLGHGVQTASVDVDFFDVLGAPMLSGRGFHSADLETGARVVIVNQAFVREILGDRNAIGRRVRYARESDDEKQGPWYEIVGVARDLAMDRDGLDPGMPAGLYHPLAAGDAYAARMAARRTLEAKVRQGDAYVVRMAVRVQGDPVSFAPRLRRIATALDPTLRLYDLLPLAGKVALTRAVHQLNRLIVSAIALVALMALLISASGTYSLMSFTVARRTREIGIRAALGAGPRRIVMAIFSRALAQIGIGVVAGALVSVVLIVVLGDPGPDSQTAREGLSVLLAVAAVLMVVGLLACGVPARRALRIEPTEALKEA